MPNPDSARFGKSVSINGGTCGECGREIEKGEDVAFDNWKRARRPWCVQCADERVSAGEGRWRGERKEQSKMKSAEKCDERFERSLSTGSVDCDDCEMEIVDGQPIAFDRWSKKKDRVLCMECAEVQIASGKGNWKTDKPSQNSPPVAQVVSEELIRSCINIRIADLWPEVLTSLRDHLQEYVTRDLELKFRQENRQYLHSEIEFVAKTQIEECIRRIEQNSKYKVDETDLRLNRVESKLLDQAEQIKDLRDKFLGVQFFLTGEESGNVIPITTNSNPPVKP